MEKTAKIISQFLALPKVKLVSGMFSDALDKLGYRQQVITGLSNNNQFGKCFGCARTVQLEDIETADENIRTGLSFVEQLDKGQIIMVQASHNYAYFGELMSRLAIRQNLEGVVIGGLTRDTSFTFSLDNLSIFAAGYSPIDIKGRGRVKAVDVPIIINKIDILPHNLIFADNDGIIVIPNQALADLYPMIVSSLADEADIIKRIDNHASIEEILDSYKEF